MCLTHKQLLLQLYSIQQVPLLLDRTQPRACLNDTPSLTEAATIHQDTHTFAQTPTPIHTLLSQLSTLFIFTLRRTIVSYAALQPLLLTYTNLSFYVHLRFLLIDILHPFSTNKAILLLYYLNTSNIFETYC